MRNARFAGAVWVALSALAAAQAACSIGPKEYAPDARSAQSGGPPDAAAGPFDCYKKLLPTMANDPVVISGTVRDPVDGKKIMGAQVEAVQPKDSAQIFELTTDSSGSFTDPVGTGGAPRDLYLHAFFENAFRDTYFYPAVLVAHDLQADLLMLTSADLSTIAAAAQIAPPDPSKALIAVTVTDCNGVPQGGAQVTTSPPGKEIVYFDSSLSPLPPGPGQSTDSMTGTAIVVDAPAQSVMIMATLNGMTLRTHAIDAIAGVLTETEIQP